MRRAHGQSKYTQQKQRHLQMFLEAGTNGWISLLKRNPQAALVVIDCTAGSGYSDDGEPGSPLILNRHFCQRIGKEFPGRFRQLCCEQKKLEYDKLRKIDLEACDLKQGNYKDLVMPWLQSLSYPLYFGLLYCDVNGILEALDGIPLFESLQQSEQTKRIDLSYNVSLNAYKRHKAVIPSLYNGVAPDWLTVPLIEHLDRLADMKKKNFIRCEMGKLAEWVMLYGLNTGEVRMTRRTERIIPYEEWRENAEYYLEGGPKVAPGQLRMEL